jgi:hypothetical protein
MLRQLKRRCRMPRTGLIVTQTLIEMNMKINKKNLNQYVIQLSKPPMRNQVDPVVEEEDKMIIMMMMILIMKISDLFVHLMVLNIFKIY